MTGKQFSFSLYTSQNSRL